MPSREVTRNFPARRAGLSRKALALALLAVSLFAYHRFAADLLARNSVSIVRPFGWNDDDGHQFTRRTLHSKVLPDVLPPVLVAHDGAPAAPNRPLKDVFTDLVLRVEVPSLRAPPPFPA